MQTWLILAALLTTLCCYCKADIKILREINIFSDDAFRKEIISLKNENTDKEELVIEGTQSQSIYPQGSSDFVYRLETIYVANKDGYQVKFKLVREPYTPVVLQLNPSSLKALTG